MFPAAAPVAAPAAPLTFPPGIRRCIVYILTIVPTTSSLDNPPCNSWDGKVANDTNYHKYQKYTIAGIR